MKKDVKTVGIKKLGTSISRIFTLEQEKQNQQKKFLGIFIDGPSSFGIIFLVLKKLKKFFDLQKLIIPSSPKQNIDDFNTKGKIRERSKYEVGTAVFDEMLEKTQKELVPLSQEKDIKIHKFNILPILLAM